MDGLKAQWNDADVRKVFTELEAGAARAFIHAFAYIGEQFVNQARRKGAYTDRTGNLRSSVGYAILVDGKVMTSKFQGNAQGETESRALVDRLKDKLPGMVLICMAGMAYAGYVESRGYDVITGSTPADNDIANTLRTLCKTYLQ